MKAQDSDSNSEAERRTGSKIQKLRERNAELAAMAKRLEEKAKELQKPISSRKVCSYRSPSIYKVAPIPIFI